MFTQVIIGRCAQSGDCVFTSKRKMNQEDDKTQTAHQMFQQTFPSCDSYNKTNTI